MKKFSKILSVALLVALVLSLGITNAFADQNVGTASATTGTITISNATVGEKYQGFKVFDARVARTEGDTAALSDDGSNGITYTWGGTGTMPTNDYFVVNEVTGEITATAAAKDSTNDTLLSAGAIAQIKSWINADPSLGFAVTDEITATDTTLNFNGLAYGYWYFTSTMGTVVTINSTNPNATVIDKNETTIIDKTVQEDSLSSDEDPTFANDAIHGYQDNDDAEIGQIVYYKTEIPIKAGAMNYHLYDLLSEGLTLKTDSIEVSVITKTTPTEGDATTETATVSAENYTITTDVTKTAMYDETHHSTFDILFNNDWLAGHVPTKVDGSDVSYTILVKYAATVNDNAVIERTGNPNDTYLSFGNNSRTQEDETLTYVYQFDLVKYTTKTDGATTTKPVLPGAKFKLYRSTEVGENGKLKDNATPISFVYNATGNTYKLADGLEQDTTVTEITTVDGKVPVIGLDDDVYYLEETEAPAGYNKLETLIQVTVIGTIDETTKVATTTVKSVSGVKQTNGNVTYTPGDAVTGTVTIDNHLYVSGGVAVLNNSGTVLPSTGGIGTTIFYVVGGVLVLAAIILLVTKKRMSE